MEAAQLNWVANFIWGIADDVLRDLYVRGKYRDVILPMTVLRRLDAVLEPTKKAVLDMKASLDKAKVVHQDQALRQAAGQAFYNTSKFTLRDLKARSSQQQLRVDFEAYLDGFSPNVQDILDNFEFRNQIPRLSGPYEYRMVGTERRHTRAVDWVRPDVPRTAFEQDLLYSFGAFMTVCNVSRNDAERRVAAVLEGKSDPGPLALDKQTRQAPVPTEGQTAGMPDLSQLAHDQIVAHIQARFAGHALARLVAAVLSVDGWVTKVSPPGADGGLDILAGRGSLGLDAPRLCVQVKSGNITGDVTVYRTLQGTMQTFKAEQGLLVCWGGFNKAVLSESKQGHFIVRLWDSSDLVQAVYRNYEQLPAEIQAELPLKRVWMLVTEEHDE